MRVKPPKRVVPVLIPQVVDDEPEKTFLDNQTILKLNRLGELEKENFDLKGELARVKMMLDEALRDQREQNRVAFAVIQRLMDDL